MRDDRPAQTGSPGLAVAPTIACYGSMDPRAQWGEATALFIAGSGAAGYAARRDLTAIARASFRAGGRTAVTDQGPARVVHRRDRMASGATMDGSST